tara:strand:+ start:69 stop:677 length:609 start_codon:yes stop_codon:yes gene_type:complete
MAHAFTIIDSSNEKIVYTNYDDIPLATLKHVISFIPDLGTEEQSNEILLEIDTLNFGQTDKFVEESEENNIVLDGTDSSSANVGDNLIMENAEGRDKLVPENFADGTENHLILELIDGDIIFGPFVRLETGTTDVLLNETGGKIIFDNIVGDAVGADHFHPPVGEPHAEGDGHTEAEHREIALWNFKLKKLITQESTNASSN